MPACQPSLAANGSAAPRPVSADWLKLIYEGSLENQPWLELLKALRRHLHCSHANIAFHRRASPGTWFDSVLDCDDDKAPGLQDYLEKYASLDPIPYQSLSPGRPYLGRDIYNFDGSFYREFLHPQGIDDLVIILIEDGCGMRAWLTLARDTTQPKFSADDCDFITSLTPYFAAALKVFSALKATEMERDIYRDALNNLLLGTLLVDQNAHVVRVDAAAARILERHPEVAVVNTYLRVTHQADDAKLRDAIAASILDSSSATPTYSFAMRLTANSNLTLVIRALKPNANSANEKNAVAIVYLSDAEAESVVSEEQLVELFGLTTTEAALTRQLVCGRTLAEAAQILHLSEQTARTYSKHIFAKTGTHRQAELVRLILSSAALFTRPAGFRTAGRSAHACDPSTDPVKSLSTSPVAPIRHP